MHEGPKATLPEDPSDMDFVTVVSVGSVETLQASQKAVQPINDDYVTVLEIGNSSQNCAEKEIIEEILIYRLPGERLGFGLKFEGGTKSDEFVKRLFIQSCAPDSPASMARCSWGNLVEGDEVLKIDLQPVSNMTRIDCVRSLKDSNVVIKLIVKHVNNPVNIKSDSSVKENADSPVISAEKVRLPPPPPPPVPPRRLSRKLSKDPIPLSEPSSPIEPTKPSQRCIKFPNQNRRASNDSEIPPDASVYLDLLSQEPGCYLSESDDTESSISTVIDRFGSLPNTTTSSFAGSLPSTPTAVQKKLNLSGVLYTGNDDDFEMFAMDNHFLGEFADEELGEKDVTDGLICNSITNSDHHVGFNDAQLSYGNEKVECAASVTEKIQSQPNNTDENANCIRNDHILLNTRSVTDDIDANLPRLVHIVPKVTTDSDHSGIIKKVQQFLANEIQFGEQKTAECDQQFTSYFNYIPNSKDVYSSDIYNLNWRLSPQLATIGEDDEEVTSDSISTLASEKSIPELDLKRCVLPIIETGDSHQLKDSSSNNGFLSNGKLQPKVSSAESSNANDLFGKFKSKPLFKDQQCLSTVREKIAKFSNGCVPSTNDVPLINSKKYSKSVEDIFSANENAKDLNLKSASEEIPTLRKPNGDIESRNDKQHSYQKTKSRSSLELTLTTPLREQSTLKRRHSISQSLGVRKEGNTKCDRWSLLAEQRLRSLSKLKGLVIPEQVNEVDDLAFVDLPEIKSKDEPITIPEHTTMLKSCHFSLNKSIVPRESSDRLLYSPAFKRKDVQVHNNGLPLANNKRIECESASVLNNLQPNYSTIIDDEASRDRTESLAEAPRSLESITSPTQSDCSFEYNSSSSETKFELCRKIKAGMRSHSLPNGKDATHSEEESDDSAVSSSQSSYISKVSPPSSPNGFHTNFITQTNNINLYSRLDNAFHNRLLKAHSVEAINRKNILASAKCRSGQDLKRGSPLIQRRFEEESIDCISQYLYKNTDAHKTNTHDIEYDNSLTESSELQPIETVQDVKCSINENDLNCTKAHEETSEATLSKTTVIKNDKELAKTSFKDNRTSSVTDLRKSFEKLAPVQYEAVNGKNSFLPTITKVHAKECLSVVQNTNQNHVTKKSSSKPCVIGDVGNVEAITLKSDIPGGSIGITLAGGADYETKVVTIHKIRNGSAAHRDGRLKKGDNIVAINGKSLDGLTHAEIVAVLKEPLPEVTLTVTKHKVSSIPISKPRSTTISEPTPITPKEKDTGSLYVVPVLKDVSGLGFSLDGGQDSLTGNVPLVVKKIFKGGAAEKSGNLYVGDQLLKVNDIDVSRVTRFEAWSVLKRFPESERILLTIKR